jgi:hypothetical protein
MGPGVTIKTKLSWIDGVAVAALACYAAAGLPILPNVVGRLAGTVLCFALAGVALASAIIPQHVSPTARFTAVTACAIGAGTVGGVLLNYLPSGLVSSNWLGYALVTTLVSCVAARVRGAGGRMPRARAPIPSWTAGAKVLTALLLVTAAMVISVSSKNQDRPFTELWLVPDNPAQLPAGATRAVVGIKSHETSVQDFTVVMDTGKQVMTSRVTLEPNEAWTQAVPVEGAKAVASVYLGDPAGEPYRTVWIDAQ